MTALRGRPILPRTSVPDAWEGISPRTWSIIADEGSGWPWRQGRRCKGFRPGRRVRPADRGWPTGSVSASQRNIDDLGEGRPRGARRTGRGRSLWVWCGRAARLAVRRSVSRSITSASRRNNLPRDPRRDHRGLVEEAAGPPEEPRPAPLHPGHPEERHRLRHRPGGHGQDLPGRGHGRLRAPAQAGDPDHPDPAGRRGGREARLSAGHARREDQPVPAAALRRAVRHDRGRAGRAI